MRLLIPIPTDESDTKAYNQTKATWLEYLGKIRIAANVVVFHCLQTSKALNYALRFKVYSKWTKLTLLSMRRDPDHGADIDHHGPDNAMLPKRLDLDNWLLQCRQRIRSMESCMFLWNAGMPVINE